MRHLTKVFFIVAAIIYVLSSCHKGAATDNERSEAEVARLKMVSDSVDAKSPLARAMIDSALLASKDSLTFYDYYIELGHFFFYGKPDSVIPVSERILHFAQGLPSTPRTNGLKAEALHLRANYYYYYHANHDKVISDNLAAYHLFLNSDMKNNVPSLCANIGDAYIQKSLLPDAAAWYRRALVISDSLNLPKENDYSLYMGLGHIYCLLKDYELSENYYGKAREGFDDMQANLKLYFLNNYGNLQYYKGDFVKALAVFESLDSLIDRYGMKGMDDDYLCRLNMADVYLNLGKTKESMECLAPADSFFRSKGVTDCIYYCNTIRIGNILKTGNVSQISNILANEPPGLTTIEDMIDIRNRYLHDYYASVGDRQRADYYERVTLARKDSIDKSREHMRASDLMMRLAMDTLMLHNQLRMEEKNAELEHNRLIFVIIAGIILLVALVLLILNLYQNKRNRERETEIANLKIEKARNSISPHFTFNVLQHAMVNIPQEAMNTINGIIKLMHSELDVSKQKYIPIRQELAFTKQYIKVATTTMDDDFTYQVNVPEGELQDIRFVPSTFIQILAENALKHGLRKLSRPKNLTIEVKFTDEETIISVTDNGDGFDIRSQAAGTGTGLKVIRSTMSLHNKVHREKIHFDIDNIYDEKGTIKGCKATLTLPASLGDKEQGAALSLER